MNEMAAGAELAGGAGVGLAPRRGSVAVKVGDIAVGGGAPVVE